MAYDLVIPCDAANYLTEWDSETVSGNATADNVSASPTPKRGSRCFKFSRVSGSAQRYVSKALPYVLQPGQNLYIGFWTNTYYMYGSAPETPFSLTFGGNTAAKITIWAGGAGGLGSGSVYDDSAVQQYIGTPPFGEMPLALDSGWQYTQFRIKRALAAGQNGEAEVRRTAPNGQITTTGVIRTYTNYNSLSGIGTLNLGIITLQSCADYAWAFDDINVVYGGDTWPDPPKDAFSRMALMGVGT